MHSDHYCGYIEIPSLVNTSRQHLAVIEIAGINIIEKPASAGKPGWLRYACSGGGGSREIDISNHQDLAAALGGFLRNTEMTRHVGSKSASPGHKITVSTR
jgi:hypothetical protein